MIFDLVDHELREAVEMVVLAFPAIGTYGPFNKHQIALLAQQNPTLFTTMRINSQVLTPSTSQISLSLHLSFILIIIKMD